MHHENQLHIYLLNLKHNIKQCFFLVDFNRFYSRIYFSWLGVHKMTTLNSEGQFLYFGVMKMFWHKYLKEFEIVKRKGWLGNKRDKNSNSHFFLWRKNSEQMCIGNLINIIDSIFFEIFITYHYTCSLPFNIFCNFCKLKKWMKLEIAVDNHWQSI